MAVYPKSFWQRVLGTKAATSGQSQRADKQRREPPPNALLSRSRRYTIRATGLTERPFAGDETPYVYALIYPVKSVASGIPTANDNAINVGRDPNFLPYLRVAADASNYIVLDPGASGNVGKLEDIFVQGTAGDGFVIEWA